MFKKFKFTLVFIIFILFISPSFCQIIDDFEDGDFTTGTVWSGNDASYIIENGILRSNDSNPNTSFYLSTPSTLALNTKWEIWVNLQFATSGSNYTDIYLTSDNANLTTSQNAYFVRIGNTQDEVSLYKKVNGTDTKIIDGADAAISSSSNNLIRLRITRDVNDLWTLRRDLTGTGNSYFTEGSITDNSISTSSYFGILVRQSTSSFFFKHFFDDINVSEITPDNTPPSLVSASLSSPNIVDVLFSESMDASSVQNLSNYNISPSTVQIQNVEQDALNSALVKVTFNQNLQSGIDYNLSISNVSDEAGNVILNSPVSAPFYIAKQFEIVINEIMADPDPQIGLPNAEYLEIYNRTNKNINLKGYSVRIGSTTRTFEDVNLNANQYAIVTAENNASLFSGTVLPLNLSSSAITNTGTNISLSNSINEELHGITFSDSWYGDAEKSAGGWSLEQIDFNNPCSGSVNWTASNNNSGGTPGIQNSVFAANPDNISPAIRSISPVSNTILRINFSEIINTQTLNNSAIYSVSNGIGNPLLVNTVSALSDFIIITLAVPLDSLTAYTLTINTPVPDCIGNSGITLTSPPFSIYRPKFLDVVFNEIMADPDPPVGLPNVEYIEFYNRTSLPINAANWKFKYGNSEKVITDGTIPANGYAILSSINGTNTYGQFYSVLSSSLSNSGFLTNSGTTLSISDSLNRLISSVTYSDIWYRSSSKISGGWSLEQIDPNNSCEGASNWIASLSPTGGTPGNVNSVNSENPDNTLPKINSACIIQNTLRIVFSEFVFNDLLNNVSFFTVDNNIGNPNTISFSGDIISNSITLEFINSFDQNSIYNLTISAPLKDCAGNTVNTSINYKFSNRTANPFDVVINEIMADPDPVVGLPSAEYIELFNKSEFPISLQGWNLTAGSSNSVLGCVTIPSKSFVLVVDDSNEGLLSDYGSEAVASSLSLTNDGSTIVLRNNQSSVISSINYSIDWYKSTIKNSGGWSLEQIDPDNPCGEADNWSASNNLAGGTPGSENSVKATNPDNSSPEPLRAYPINSNTVRITFSEALNIALETNMFSGDNGLGNPVFAYAVEPNYKEVILQFNQNIQQNTIYTISFFTGITDCVGNPLVREKIIKFGLPKLPIKGDVILTEILSDTPTELDDFIEIYNNSDKIIDLKELRTSSYDTLNLTFGTIYAIDTTGYLIFPGEYYVISKTTNLIRNFYSVPKPENMVKVSSFPSLSIASGSIALSRWDNEIIDGMYYDEQMHFPLLLTTKGVTLEKIDLKKPSNLRSNWISAAQTAGFGTPTGINSQNNASAELSGTLSLSNGFISPDNDGYQDIVEIGYELEENGLIGNLEVYDNKGRLIKKIAENNLMGTKGSFQWNGITETNEKTPIGIYQIILSVNNLEGKKQIFREVIVVAGKL